MVKHTKNKIYKKNNRKTQKGGEIQDLYKQCTTKANEHTTSSALSRYLLKWSKDFKKFSNKPEKLKDIKNLWITIYTCFTINQNNKNYIINIIKQYYNFNLSDLDNLFSATVKLQELQDKTTNNETKVNQTAIINYINNGSGTFHMETMKLLDSIKTSFNSLANIEVSSTKRNQHLFQPVSTASSVLQKQSYTSSGQSIRPTQVKQLSNKTKEDIKQTVKKLIDFFEKLNNQQLQPIFGIKHTIKTIVLNAVKNGTINDLLSKVEKLPQMNENKIKELAKNLQNLLDKRKLLQNQTTEHAIEDNNNDDNNDDECDFQAFKTFDEFIQNMINYINNNLQNRIFGLYDHKKNEYKDVSASDILLKIYNIFVQNKKVVNQSNINIVPLKEILTECDFEEDYDNFDEQLKEACIKIYEHYKKSKNINTGLRRNSGYNSMSRRNSIKSSITEQQPQQQPQLPTKQLICNNLQNTIKSTSDRFFEVLGNTKLYSLNIPQDNQTILKKKFLEIFTKACDDINGAKNLKQILQSKYNDNDNDIDILYTLYHIFIIDHLQYSNIHIYSHDDVISEHYGTNATENSKNNITIKYSPNPSYKTLAMKTLQKYEKLKNKTFAKFKKYLMENN